MGGPRARSGPGRDSAPAERMPAEQVTGEDQAAQNVEQLEPVPMVIRAASLNVLTLERHIPLHPLTLNVSLRAHLQGTNYGTIAPR